MPQEGKVHFNHITEPSRNISLNNLTGTESRKNCPITCPSLPTYSFSIDREQELKIMNWGLGAEREGAEGPYPFPAGSKPELRREDSHEVKFGLIIVCV